MLASGLSPLEALVANGGTATASLYGWPEPHPDDASHAGTVAAAEALTDRLATDAYAAPRHERAHLAHLLTRAEAATGLGGK